MKYKWTKKYDKLSFGLIAGLIFPIVGFFISYLVIGGNASLLSYWENFIKTSGSGEILDRYIENRQNILMYCLIANMALFYPVYFIWKMDRFSKGIVGTTLLLTAISFILIY